MFFVQKPAFWTSNKLLQNMREKIAIIGLGKIGSALTENFLSKDFKIYGFDKKRELPNSYIGNFERINNLKDFLNSTSPKLVFLTLPSGRETYNMLKKIRPMVGKEDIILDLSNSMFRDSINMEKRYSQEGKSYVDVGISGGVDGAKRGASLMVGNKKKVSKNLEKLLEKICAKNQSRPCIGFYEKAGSGHLVKMIHNLLEYAEMQLIAETLTCLHSVYHLKHKSVLSFLQKLRLEDKKSYLLKITEKIYKDHLIDEQWSDSSLVKHNGTAKWATQLALEIESVTPSLFSAVNERIALSQKPCNPCDSITKFKLLQINGKKLKNLISIFQLSRASLFIQMHDLLEDIKNTSEIVLDPKSLSSNWENGAIVKSNSLKLMSMGRDEIFSKICIPQKRKYNSAVASLVFEATNKSISLPVIYSSWQFVNSNSSRTVTSKIIGYQRLIFGGHDLEELKK